MAKAVIFDLYGVLALNGWQAFKARHFTDRPEVWDQVFELGRQVDAGLADYQELIIFTARQSGASETDVRHELEHTAANSELLAYIRNDLKSGYGLGILSNAGSEAVLDIFSQADRELFDAVVLSRHVGLTKPDSRMYQVVAEKLGVEPSECVFIDDQERHAAGARDAGMQSVVYIDLAQLKAELKPLLADS